MRFIEIDDKYIVNIDNITVIEKSKSKYDPNVDFSTIIRLVDGVFVSCGKNYYNKLKDIVKPTHLENERQEKL